VSGIRDNHTRGAVADFLRAKTADGAELSVVSAYFTIYAFDALKAHLARVGGLRFLFGEPRFVKELDPDRTDARAFHIQDDGICLANRLEQKRAARECADWLRDKVEIRSVVRSGFLHGKLYHISHDGAEDAIVGSSNFTVRGLGLADVGNNIELNLEVDSRRDRQDLKAWFDEFWNDADLVRDVKPEVLAYLAQLYRDQAPEFVYYKTLYHVFEEYLGDTGRTADELARTTLFDTHVWQALFDFQKDGVKGAINRILTHNGCIVADSVGLGKTYEALAVIKYFELRNERALVLCPKKLRDNWTVYKLNDLLNPFAEDRFRYDVLCHTDLSRDAGHSGDVDLETLNWGNYDLIVIDESHNFRNNTPGKRDEHGALVRKSRYQRLLEDIIQAGVRTKVLLLSATPVNTNLRDLRNQVYFITSGSDTAFAEAFGIRDIGETLRQAQAQFSAWARQRPESRRTRDLLMRLGSEFFKLLDELTIARSRKHIRRYYKDAIERIGGFPERAKPVSLFPEIDLQGQFLPYDKIDDEISKYRLSLFNPSRFVKPEYHPEYERKFGNFTQAQREGFLIGMMKVNFLKRLESSIHSFRVTLARTVAKIEELEERIAKFRELMEERPELGFDYVDRELIEDPELEGALEVGKKLRFRMAHLDLEEWEKELAHDKAQLRFLHDKAAKVTPGRDAKLAELKRIIEAKVRAPTTTRDGAPNRKALVFAAFADTATYLYDALRDWAREELGVHVALVTGSGDNRATLGRTDYHHILTNFAPQAKNRAKIPGMPQDEEIDLLIATDCISEGQNLQDCDLLVNYDIHWNPVRIIQRFGRIDRIGSRNPAVRLVNFWPTPNLDRYISLKHRVEARMALADIAATFEDNMLATRELEDMVTEDLKYRDRQLLRLKDEILDLDDLEDSVSLTEFTLDDFRVDLLKHLEANRLLLEEAPLGLYAVVPPEEESGSAPPGVIFCLRHKAGRDEARVVNPLQPYFLVYVLADGAVRLTFAQPKQVLETFRHLCLGEAVPNEALCRLFDEQTENGANMTPYTALLDRAVSSIAHTFRRRVAGGLRSGRGFTVPKHSEQATEATDYELVTWLAVLPGEPAPDKTE